MKTKPYKATKTEYSNSATTNLCIKGATIMKKLLFTIYTLAVIICIIGILIFNDQTLFPILSILILLCFMYPHLNYYYIFKQNNAINQFYQILHKYSKITIYPTITIFIIAFLAQNCYIINYFKNQDMLDIISMLVVLFLLPQILIFQSSLDKYFDVIKNNQFDTTIPLFLSNNT